MARPTNRLSARAVQTAKPGYHADGAGLYLLVTQEGTASWVFRFARHGRKREMGLGSAVTFTLAEARERAREARKTLADGFDPIEHRKALRTATVRTWGEAAEEFIGAHEAGWKNEDQAAQWRQSLAAYGPDSALPISAVDTQLVLTLLRKVWTTKTETATRVRGRIERIWSAEKIKGNVSGENPAHWKGHLEHLLPKPSKVKKVKHFDAMPYEDAPGFMGTLRERENISRKSLRFTILTAVRTNETTGAVWPEFDLAHKLWTIPEERMKAGDRNGDHVVPLCEEAIAILKTLPRDQPPFPISDGTMLGLLQKDLEQPYTVHGFRSTFHDWASENDWPEHIIDLCLAHAIDDKVKAAYRRTALIAQRRKLMQAWAEYLA
jgi:integrase